jgi:hypothetical protein
MVVWPVPEMSPTETELAASRAQGWRSLARVRHPVAPLNDSTDLHADCQRALDPNKRVIA